MPLSLHDDTRIGILENARGLGISVTNNVKSCLNPKLNVSRARARLFQVHRRLVVMTREVFLLLYLGFGRPIPDNVNSWTWPWRILYSSEPFN